MKKESYFNERNIVSPKGFILLVSAMSVIWSIFDGNGLEGAEYILLLMLAPAFMVFFTDFSKEKFYKKIETIFVFAALVPIAFDPVIDLLRDSRHEYSLYALLAVSMVLFLFVYMTRYVEWISVAAYFALLVFTFALFCTSTIFISIDLFCDRDGVMKKDGLCEWVYKTIEKEEVKEDI